MTSLGGQLSARRPGDSPFTIRTEGISVGKVTQKWVQVFVGLGEGGL